MLQIQGQSRAIAQIQRAMGSGRLASTWIFAGPAGIGKFTTAVDFAKTVLCDHPKRAANGTLETPLEHLGKTFEVTLACGVCESCRAVAIGSHPDLHIITKELIRMHDRAGKSMGTTMSIQVIRGEITGDPAWQDRVENGQAEFSRAGEVFYCGRGGADGGAGAKCVAQDARRAAGGESYLILVSANPRDF